VRCSALGASHGLDREALIRATQTRREVAEVAGVTFFNFLTFIVMSYFGDIAEAEAVVPTIGRPVERGNART